VTIIDEPLLKLYRVAGCCELCGRWCSFREAHHVRTRGSGRLDHRFNIVGTCPSMAANCCHTKIHFSGLYVDGKRVTRARMEEIIAEREGVSPEEVRAEMDRLRRTPNDPGERRPKKRKPPKPRDPDPPKCLLCSRPVRSLYRDTPKGKIHRSCWIKATSEARQAAMRKDGAA
jgi:hypothetical protein